MKVSFLQVKMHRIAVLASLAINTKVALGRATDHINKRSFSGQVKKVALEYSALPSLQRCGDRRDGNNSGLNTTLSPGTKKIPSHSMSMIQMIQSQF
jgi:hypothetical protein